MPGREEAGRAFRPIVYCVIPRDLAPLLHDCLRRCFASDPSVEVIVERRTGERRASVDRRAAVDPATGPGDERRRVRGASGRRVGSRRAIVAELPAPGLPRRARAHADRIAFVERLEPSSQQTEDLDTARLVTRFQAGDRDAFAALYTRHFDRVFAYLRTLLRDVHEAEDATQQVFIKVLRALHRFEPDREPFRAWLFVIARNYALSVLKRNGRIELLEPDEVDRRREEPDEEMPLTALEWISDRELVMFTERLPLAQRQVLLLRFMLDLPHSQVASILGRTPVEVRDLQRRALSFLRARLTAVGRDVRPGRGARMVRRPGHAYVLRKRRFALTHPN
jgi:RNA polymerase sigma-70 factor (ECF subfamily)